MRVDVLVDQSTPNHDATIEIEPTLPLELLLDAVQLLHRPEVHEGGKTEDWPGSRSILSGTKRHWNGDRVEGSEAGPGPGRDQVGTPPPE